MVMGCLCSRPTKEYSTVDADDECEMVGLAQQCDGQEEAAGRLRSSAADMLLEAVTSGDSTSLLQALDAGADVDHADSDGRTALVKCSAYGHVEAVGALLSRGATTTVQTAEGQCALHCAAADGHEQVVLLLLGASDCAVDLKDEDGRTALHFAAAAGFDVVCASLLAHGSDCNVSDCCGSTPLHMASSAGAQRAAEALLAAGAAVEAKTEDGSTALHKAARNKRLPTASLLLGRGADVDERDLNLRTALHHALYAGGGSDLVLCFLHAGADPAAYDYDFNSCLDLAATASNKEAVAILTSWLERQQHWAKRRWLAIACHMYEHGRLDRTGLSVSAASFLGLPAACRMQIILLL